MIRWRISNWFFPLHFTYSESCKIELQKTRIGLCCAYFPANEIETPKRENTSFSTGQHKLIVPIYFFNDEHYNCAQIHQVWEFILLVTTFLWSLNEIRTNRLVPSIAEATLRITSTLFVRFNQGCTDTEYGMELFLNAYYPSQIFFKLDLKRGNKARQSIPSMPFTQLRMKCKTWT